MTDFNLDSFRNTYKDFARGYLFTATISNSKYWKDDNSYLVKTASMPATEQEEILTSWQGNSYKLAATPTYADFTINFQQDMESELRTKFLKWMTYNHNMDTNVHGTVDNSSGNYFSDIVMKQLDVKGKEFNRCTLYGAWPKSVGEISLDYSAKEIAVFDVSFTYQYHIYE